MNAGVAWSYGKCFLHICTIFLYNSSNDRFYTSMIRSSVRRTTYPFSLRVDSNTWGGGDWEMTCGILHIMSSSSFCVSCTNSMYVTLISFSSFWASSQSYICSTSSSIANCFGSSTCIDIFCSVVVPWLFYSSYFFFSSPSLLLNSYSSFNFFFISCKFRSTPCSSPFLSSFALLFSSITPFLLSLPNLPSPR